jgi:hypothetical protein
MAHEIGHITPCRKWLFELHVGLFRMRSDTAPALLAGAPEEVSLLSPTIGDTSSVIPDFVLMAARARIKTNGSAQ